MGKPKFKHDCDDCNYVKTEKYRGTLVDFYVCGDTVVYRDGNEPQMNGSVSFNNNEEFYMNAYEDLYKILQEFNSQNSK